EPKCLPGGRSEAALDLGGGDAKKLLLKLPFPVLTQVVLRSGLFLEAVLGITATAGPGLGVAAAEKACQLVARDTVEPAAERALRGIVVPVAYGPGDRQKNLLRQVGSVRVLQAALSNEAIDQGAVEVDEFLPGVAVARIAQAGEQAT